ncbi:heterokaryon incompatibility [Fusarium albosuccineum]|uniref:Heterokaryon incompatibility n=1 Tax=Fusarium albosuccineum TaxID=1237068 RepID=A0A8H4P470_9HYPO|nr:heterokaryon incompatibility [Fusarium albosuccineum]
MSATISLPKDDFTLALPEDPYHVRKTTAYQKGTSFREFPDQIFLQFFTLKTPFHIVPVIDDTVDSSDSGDIVGAGLRRCHIMDRCADKCGSIVIDSEWLRQKGLLNDDMDDATESTEFEFIAISEAKMFTKDEFLDWIYYIAKERVEEEWNLFFVLLIENFPVEGLYRQVALAKVFKAAFSLTEDNWKEILLG